MASLDKFKDAAKKFEQKDQWAKAIEQYQKAIEVFEATPEADDAELGLYNKVGDLYQKSGDTTQAIAFYERAIDKNTEAGLVNQGIALSNKVLRLSPGRAQIYLKLGLLFAKKGFQAEAKQNLLEYADRMQKAGQLEAAFAALKKFAEMTPEQGDIWGVLAAQLRAAAKTSEQKEQVEKLLGEFENKDKVEKRKSRMSRSMITGEELPPEPKAKSELVFLDLEEPAPPRKSAAAMKAPTLPQAPPPPPPPKAAEPAAPPEAAPEVEALEIESTSLAGEEPAVPAADLPLMDVEPTALGEEPAAAAAEDLGLEPTSFEPPAAAAEPAAVGEDLGAIDLDMGELSVEEPAAPPTAGLPMMDLGEAAQSAPQPAEAPSVGGELEFMDLGVPEPELPAAPTVADLEARLAANSEDWEAHRLLGEALLEQGERERGLAALDASAEGYDQAGDLATAMTVVEEMLRLEPNSIRYQQKRVELAYRQGDKARLADAYVELADALLRSNEVEKAVAVYQRVIEHDPSNVRARSALETLAPPAAAEPSAPAAPARVSAPRAAAAPPTPAVPAAPAEAGEYVDLGALLFDEEEGPKDTRMRIEDEEPSGDEQKDFQSMLSAFKKGIEANVGEEDFQSHYDLGVAYKEMGLLDEAIAEFQKALRAPDGKLKSSEALGLCFFEKGQFAVAETIMRRGLEMPAHDDRERIGLLYWLGRTLEEQRKKPEALAAYNRVFAVDINFADIGERVKAVSGAGV